MVKEFVDYLYKLQKDETVHQNHRLMWILTAQALIFAALCALVSKPQDANTYNSHLIVLLILVGVLISISGIYSMLISKTAIGTVYERWKKFDSLPIKYKTQVTHHLISLAPTHLLKSKFGWLMFYNFAPNVFCSAWVTLILMHFNIIAISSKNPFVSENSQICLLFIIVLAIIILISHFIGRLFMYHWGYDEYHNNIHRENNSDSYNPASTPNTENGLNIYRGIGHNENSIILNSFNNYYSDYCKNLHHNCHILNSKEPNSNSKLPNSTEWNNFKIYHIMVDRFNGNWVKVPKNCNKFLGGNIRGIIEKIDYIKSLGYNAVMITPIFQSEAYHGYHISDYESIDYHFGDWGDFDCLVEGLHKKNMKLICDYVPNHCHINHPFFKAAQEDENSPYRSWFFFDQSKKGGFVSFQNIPDMPKFNLYDEGASDYLISIAIMLTKRGVDGLRIDHVIGVPFTFLEKLQTKIKEINPNLFLFGEAWFNPSGDLSQIEFIDRQQKEKAYKKQLTQEDIQLNYINYLDGVLDFRFRDIIISEIQEGVRQDGRCQLLGNMQLLDKLQNHFNNYPDGFQLILFLDNHDTNRFLFHCQGNKLLMQEGLTLCKNTYLKPYSVYYGTDRFMYNKNDIFNGTPYADLDVREPMNWD